MLSSFTLQGVSLTTPALLTGGPRRSRKICGLRLSKSARVGRFAAQASRGSADGAARGRFAAQASKRCDDAQLERLTVWQCGDVGGRS